MLNVRFRTMTQQVIPLDLDVSTPISVCKARLSEVLNADPASLRLIYKGRILSDSASIDSLNITARDFIVIHSAKPSSPLPVRSPEPPPAAPPPPPPAAADPPPPNAEWTHLVNQLLILGGFRREEAEACLRAARGDPDLAYDYLTNGFPDDQDLEQMDQDDQLRAGYRQLLAAQPGLLENLVQMYEAQNAPDAQLFREHPEELVEDLGLPDELFQGLYPAIRNRTAPLVPNDALPQIEADGGYDEEEDVGEVQVQVQGQGQGPTAAHVANAVPAMLAQFSVEEREAIQRLQALGEFPLSQVVHIFLAANKNEMYAANLLFND
jgi:hypothetical protein